MIRAASRSLVCLSALFALEAGAVEPRWYVFGGVTGTSIETSSLQALLADEGLFASNEVSDTAFGFQIGAGVMLTKNFGVELKYSDSGDGEDDIFVTDGVDSALINVESSIDGFTLYGVAETSFAQSWDLFGKLGYTFQDGEATASAFGFSESSSGDDDGVAVAAGLRYRITPQWAVTGEVEYFAIDFDGGFDEPLRGSVNVQYFFGP